MASGNRDENGLHVVTRPGGRSQKYFFKELFSDIGRDDITGRSAQLAYYFFFALFPGFIFLSAVANLVSGGGNGVRSIILQRLSAIVPANAYGIIQQTFQQSGNHTGGLTFGVLVALWSATVGMSACCDTLNAVHEVQESRPWWKVQLTAFALTLITAVLVLCAIGALFAGDSVIHMAGSGLASGPVHILIEIGQWAVALVVAVLIFAVTYYMAPDIRERKWHWITPGASLGIIIWAGATVGLRFYVTDFGSSYSKYGSIGAVMVLLLWFYITGFALLTGAEVNAVVEDIAAQKGDPQALEKGEKAPDQAA